MQLEIDSEQVTGGVRIVDRSLPQCYQGVAIVIQRDPHPTLGHGITHDQAVERARVMAASFELLEALEGVTDMAADMIPSMGFAGLALIEAARAAIAKARGTPC